MPATSTSFGNGVFGVPAAETGIIIENISFNYSQDKKEVKDRTGNTSGVTYYNERVEVTFSGEIPATSAFSGTLAAQLTLLNTVPDHLKGAVTGGSTLIEEVSIDYGREDYQTIEVKAVIYPNIAP